MRGFTAFPLLAALVTQATCDCECGYSINATGTENSVVFTEILETDFLHTGSLPPGWIPQAYNDTPSEAQGPYGQAAQVENVRFNPIKSKKDWKAPGMYGPDPGIQLWSNASLIDIPDSNNSMVPIAELVTTRSDILYGSFRVGMMVTPVNGTCGSFFFYFNDTQEIDIEFLSEEQSNTTGYVNFVVHSPGGIDQSDNHMLSFSPSAGYNDFRFDWLPGFVAFYANNELLYMTTKHVPDHPGSIHLKHWSNGNMGWSGGPPKEDAALTISYVKAYFNSSNPATTVHDCKSDEGKGEACLIPTEIAPANPLRISGETFFFTNHDGDSSNDPSVPTPSAKSAGGRWNVSSHFLAAAMLLIAAV